MPPAPPPRPPCPAVGASVYALSHEDQLDHAPLVREFVNATHWPKHLLVHYRWRTQHEEDEEGGLLVLFSGGWPRPARLGAGWLKGCDAQGLGHIR